jgi:hypothetical protein
MPAISRPLLIVLAVAVLALVGFYATQGSRNAVDSATVAPAADSGSAPSAVAEVDESQAPAKRPRTAKSQRTAGKSRPDADKAEPASPRRARAKAASRAKTVSGLAAVRRAIDRRRRVVLLFEAPRGADDRATARAVAAQRGQRGVVVVSEPISRLARYRTLIGGLGISQAPAVVIVGKNGAARLVEGYVDPATLSQEVADAR